MVVASHSLRTLMTTAIVRSATELDSAPLIDVVVLAFSGDPVARWTWPEPQEYLRHFPSFIKAFGGGAFARESAYYIDGYAGAALWLPPGVHPDGEALVNLLRQTASERVRADASALMERMERYHPGEPHWYLPLIGVDPAYQGKGYGAALMRHALLRCDHENKLAYLESTNPRNIPLYERHGFEILGTIQAGTSPPIRPMLRKPH
jgi:ribosomal protein S18 acetylase RimI-like enzyme